MIAGLNSVKEQDPALGLHLHEVMRGQIFEYKRKTMLTDIGDKVDMALFIDKGHIIASVFDKRGDKQTIFMFGENDIKAGPEFMKELRSEFYVEAVAGTSGLYITFEQMEEVYRLFPAAQELAALITVEFRIREMQHLVSLHKKGIDRVEEFYLRFPHLLPAGQILTDAEVATFLLLSDGALRRLRRKLLREDKIVDPGKSKRKPR